MKYSDPEKVLLRRIVSENDTLSVIAKFCIEQSEYYDERAKGQIRTGNLGAAEKTSWVGHAYETFVSELRNKAKNL